MIGEGVKACIFLASGGILLALSWPGLPSFDVGAALIVGAIVAVATVVVIGLAIATPFVAIAGGATLLGTAIAVGVIAIATGIVGGAAAGLYWGRQGDIKRQEEIERINRAAGQLDIYFEPSMDDRTRAASFQCTLVIYKETDPTASGPAAVTRNIKVVEADSASFYRQVDEQVKSWLSKELQSDSDSRPRQVKIFMDPNPGEGVYERLRDIAEGSEARKVVVNKVEGAWNSAWSQ
jgi:hypothetical protein